MGRSFATVCAHCGTEMVARDKGRGQTHYYCSKACRHAGRREGEERPCLVCGKPVYRKPKEDHPHRYCSRACKDADVSRVAQEHPLRGEDRYNWQGGVIMRGGYRFLRRPDHPNANNHGYVAEHRYVMAEKIGRPLRRMEVVHHIDHDKLNNAPENLVIARRVDHSRAHRLERVLGRSGWSLYPEGCRECGTTEQRYCAKGLCDRCYSRLKMRERAAARRGNDLAS